MMEIPVRQLLAYHESGRVLQAISTQLPFFSDVDTKIGAYLMANPHKVTELSSSEMATAIGVSEASFFRFLNRIGYSYQTLRNELVKHGQLVHVFKESGTQCSTKPSIVVERTMAGIHSLCQAFAYLDSDQLDEAARAIAQAPCSQVTGMGPISGPLAEMFSYKLNRLGCTAVLQRSVPGGSDGPLFGRESDVLVAFSHSGVNEQLIDALTRHRARGGVSVAICNYEGSPFAKAATIRLITSVREEEVDQVALVPRLAQILVIEVLLETIADVVTASATDTVAR